METLTIGKLLTKHTTGLRITNNFVTLFTHYGNFIDEEMDMLKLFYLLPYEKEDFYGQFRERLSRAE